MRNLNGQGCYAPSLRVDAPASRWPIPVAGGPAGRSPMEGNGREILSCSDTSFRFSSLPRSRWSLCQSMRRMVCWRPRGGSRRSRQPRRRTWERTCTGARRCGFLGGVALIVAGAWTAFSYYDLEPTKTCGLSGMASNARKLEDDVYRSSGIVFRTVYHPDRYEFSPIMVDGTCKLEGVRHDGDWERYADGRLFIRASPYTLPFASTVERYSFNDSPSGYAYLSWRWTGGEGMVEAMTTYGDVPKTRLYSGIAMIGAGALLATLWATRRRR